MAINQDAAYMARALQLAKRGLYTTDPNPHVGCVLVRDERIIAEGWTQRAGLAHAEADALNKAGNARGATAYVTLEPCNHHGRTPPCTDALITAGIGRVVAAMQDPNPLVSGQGLAKLRDAGIEVVCGVLEQEAKTLNRGFFKRMTTGLPWIRSKLAASLDGRTAMASGESQWITSPQARHDVQRYRAASSAILTGIGTVLRDDPKLNARVDFDVVQPVKVVLDSHLRMPPTAKMLQDASEVWIMTCSNDEPKLRRLEAAGCKIQLVDSDGDCRTALLKVFKLLAEQQINTIWIEAGATLNGSLLQTGMVDEWLIYLAPCVMGDQGLGMFHLPALQLMADKIPLQLRSIRKLGPDLRLTYSHA
ncbi:MAG: bifunctional diaminohydroxyphosphoribosylaminopyrimidine deaminase/5-amino-6-(5-phosphoribosylamino)uracil reductase RibD [Methylomonas sp.]|jgi:diaminohydroxyphosphoribosylaminopyrimidine deaminase/5-amino-6-(5-phosphoribosylamino)uracil reductase